jgi:hypothetical protein
MDVHFAPHDLPSLDQLKTEALCLPLFADERPLRGAPGLIDWRLCGRISELLVSGRMRGDFGEAILMPARPRLMAERLVWLGAGPRDELEESTFRAFVRELMQVLGALKVRTAALVLPGRAVGRVESRGSAREPGLDPARAMEWFLDESLPFQERLDEVTVLDSHDAQRAMQPLVDRARRRALADL